MYPSIFNRFPLIQPVSSKVRHFNTFLAHFGLPRVRLWDNRGKCYMDGKRIQCWSNASQHIPINLQPFTSYSEILVENCKRFPTPLAFNASVDDRLSRFDKIPACDGRTDGQMSSL